MKFINRKEELRNLQKDYTNNLNRGLNQVYIIKADSGVGKSEFIKEISKKLNLSFIEVFPLDDSNDFSTFKRFVIELDKISSEYGYDDFKEFYTKKMTSDKAIKILLKISAIFGKAFIGTFFKDNNIGLEVSEIDLPSLIEEPTQYETFVLKAQVENLFEYANYVLKQRKLSILYSQASQIDRSSLDLFNKLIVTSQQCLFIFECDDNRVEQYLKNSSKFFLKTYHLNRLSNEHILHYIQQLTEELELHYEQIDFTILHDSIEKGDLAEISIILKDFDDRVRLDRTVKLQTIKQIVEELSDKQTALLILLSLTKNRLAQVDLMEILSQLYGEFDSENIDFLVNKDLLERNHSSLSIPNFIDMVVSPTTFSPKLRLALSSLLVKYINQKLYETNNAEYLDILVDHYLLHRQFLQLKSIFPKIRERLIRIDSQEGRVAYFEKFNLIQHDVKTIDEDFILTLVKIAYDANLYQQSLSLINFISHNIDKVVFGKALLLNRCEKFDASINYIEKNIVKLDKNSSQYFQLSLVLIMNLVQLERREEAKRIFEELSTQHTHPLYPYLIRLSNVFYSQFSDRIKIVQSITERIFKEQDSEFSGLHAIYLAYLYAVERDVSRAEQSLITARDYFGESLVYNHMILHNEATIKFYSGDIDEAIPELLNSAKITAYDEYDRFAIYNNLVVYYLLKDRVGSLECQSIVVELEELISKTSFKRFLDKIYYNLYHYYQKMYNLEKMEEYKNKIEEDIIKNDYEMKLMYETSWKLPLNLNDE